MRGSLARFGYRLAPEQWETIPPDHVARVRISGDIRKCVVFLGFGPEDSRDFFGTGWIQSYQHYSWLVTARHVAKVIGDAPFYLWLNAGTPKHVDRAMWTFHPDETVDVAVTPFAARTRHDSIGWLPQDALLIQGQHYDYEVNLGNFAYVIGLFKPLPGSRRFLPVTHTGHIALLPDDEPIPIRLPNGSQIETKGCYLVQAPTLSGLSGAPVFVRKAVRLREPVDNYHPDAVGEVALLGLWISSWDGLAAELLPAPAGSRVPVGMGVVVPAERIVETVKQHAKNHPDQYHPNAAKADSASVTPARISTPIAANNPENPDHKEGFTRLLTAAAKKTPQAGRT